MHTCIHLTYPKHVCVGVVAVIAPWNFPADEILLLALPALMAGNTVYVYDDVTYVYDDVTYMMCPR